MGVAGLESESLELSACQHESVLEIPSPFLHLLPSAVGEGEGAPPIELALLDKEHTQPLDSPFV